jgi:hypothetical protein
LCFDFFFSIISYNFVNPNIRHIRFIYC